MFESVTAEQQIDTKTETDVDVGLNTCVGVDMYAEMASWLLEI